MTKYIYFLLAVLLTSSCMTNSGYKSFYNQVAPYKYPKTSNDELWVFEYTNVDLDEIYDLLFSDFLIIGKSSFNGRYERLSEGAIRYARSIGADVFIASSQLESRRTSFLNMSSPTTSTTNISGYNGNGSFYGTATTYGTQTTSVPITINRYDQEGIFLKNINDAIPLWQRSKFQYKVTGTNKMSGLWKNENYGIEVVQSEDQMIAFINQVPDSRERSSWGKDELKMIYGVSSGVGVYLMGNKTPEPAKFSLNKYGFLEVSLFSGETFSFARHK